MTGRELILGGQNSGRPRSAQGRAATWLHGLADLAQAIARAIARAVAGAIASASTAQRLLQASCGAFGARVLISNGIGPRLSPLPAEAQRFAATLGRVHRQVTAACSRVLLKVAGCALVVRQEAG